MFCPQCGTKTTTGTQRFCRECGGEIGADPGQEGQRAGSGSTTMPPRQRPSMLTHVIVKDNTMKTLLIAAGLLLLLPLAIPIVFGTLVAGVVAGVALVAAAIKLAPVLALGIVLYWIVTRRRGALQSRR